jgi:hypothetical protein
MTRWRAAMLLVPAAAALRSGRVAFRGGLCVGEFDAHVAGQVLRHWDQPLGAAVASTVGSANTNPVVAVARVLLATAEQIGDLVEVDLTVGVQADRDGVGRGCPQPRAGATTRPDMTRA